MTDELERQQLDRLVERLKQKMPDRMARGIGWLVGPKAALIRIPLGLLCIAGGIFSFLPVLGIWMLPLGILLIAVDVPWVRRWVVRTWPRIEARWRLWRARRARTS